MKKISIVFLVLLFSTSAFAGSCPVIAKKVDEKISTSKKLYEEGVEAHSMGDHAKSEELLKKALDLFKG